MENRDFKGVWIPKDIWLNKDLSAIDKVILAEIDSLDNEDGCYASNKYLAEFCGVSESTITRSIRKLTKLGLIESTVVTKNNGSARVVKLTTSSSQFDETGVVNLTTGGSQFDERVSSICRLSNIDSNNTNNIDNNTNTNVVPTESDFSFGKPKKKKKSLYEKCNDSIYEFVYTTADDLLPDEKVRLVSILKIYLDFILEYDKSVSKTLYFNVWRSMLNKLKQVKNDTEDSYYDIVNYALSKSWKNFYPIPKNISSFDKPKDVADMRKEPSIKNKVDKQLEVKNRSGDTY